MSLNRPTLVVLLPLLVACGAEPFPPPANAVIGTFGGPRIELHAGARIVRVALTCSTTYFAVPIVPDATGSFVLPRTPMLGVANSSLELEVRGRIVGDQILATVTTTTPAGSYDEQHTLTRGSKGAFSGYACLATS
jgi:hypothetical protein